MDDTNNPKTKVITDSIADMRQDITELQFLVKTGLARLFIVQKNLPKLSRRLPQAAATEFVRLLDFVYGEYDTVRTRLTDLASQRTTPPESTLDRFVREKNDLYHTLRTLSGIAGSLLVSLDWQSPSFIESAASQAGMQTGKIIGTINDYKRDQHLDAFDFENAFKKEYIDGRFRFPLNSFATSSGMAAFTTILNFLVGEGKASGTVLAGQNSYFENKLLLMRTFGKNLIFVDEFDTEGIKEAIRKHQPSALFFDSMGNTDSAPMPNLTELTRFLTKLPKKHHMFLVIDNSCMGPLYQPLKALAFRPSRLHLIVFESLNKYYQFGFDRVTGGIIWTLGLQTIKLFDYRVHLGTNIPDASVASLPRPNRKLLETRMMRLGRNASELALSLDNYVKARRSNAVSHIVYPGLPSYPGYAWTKSLPFHGSFFVIAFRKRYQKISVYKRFVSLVIKEATKRNADIVSGTSFGLNGTRLYLTAIHADGTTRPFVRVAAGTETRHELARIIGAFEAAIDKVSGSISL